MWFPGCNWSWTSDFYGDLQICVCDKYVTVIKIMLLWHLCWTQLGDLYLKIAIWCWPNGVERWIRFSVLFWFWISKVLANKDCGWRRKTDCIIECWCWILLSLQFEKPPIRPHFDSILCHKHPCTPCNSKTQICGASWGLNWIELIYNFTLS